MPTFEKDNNSWNQPGVQDANNCYDYAVDKKSGRKPGPKSKSRPGKKGNKELKRPPYSCTDIITAAKADGLTESDKDKKCDDKCWKVAVMIAPDKEKGADFHWVRQDDDGGWSHKQGFGPAKNTDDDGKQIKDPEKAKIDDYKICGYMCVCPNVEVAMRTPEENQEVFASLTLKEKGTLTTRSLDLDLPPGRLTILYEDPGRTQTQAVTASVLIYSGEEDPSWEMSLDEIEVVKSRLKGLPPSDRQPEYKMGYQGFILFNGNVADLPKEIRVFDSLISLWSGEGAVESFEDVNRLEQWLLGIVGAKPFAQDVQRVIGVSVRLPG